MSRPILRRALRAPRDATRKRLGYALSRQPVRWRCDEFSMAFRTHPYWHTHVSLRTHRAVWHCNADIACNAALCQFTMNVVSTRHSRRTRFRNVANDRASVRNGAVSYGLQSRRPPNDERGWQGEKRRPTARRPGATSGDNASGLRAIGSLTARTVRSFRAVERVRRRDQCEWSGGSVAVVILAAWAAKVRSGDHEYYR